MSTRLVKNVRKITVLANQRMQVSSKNNSVKLIKNRSTSRWYDAGSGGMNDG